MKEFNYELIKASTNDFSLDCLIGKGSHGSVYKGVLKVDDKHVQQFAVKKPSPSLLQSSPSKLDNEIQILASIQSPHIVNLIGVSHGNLTNDIKLLITEFMPNGSLHDLLHSKSNQPPTWLHRMSIGLQVACAVHMLHQSHPPVIHRDIKSANILLDSCWNARLADFSLAVTCQQGTGEHDGNNNVLPAGTLGYLDPGYTESSRLGPANDMYSYGVVLMELVSGKKVVDVERDPASIVEWFLARVRRGNVGEVCDGVLDGEIEEDMVMRVLKVAMRCVESEEERRPTMAEVVGELRGVVEGLVCRPRRRTSSSSWRCRVYKRCVRAWKRCKKKRVRTTNMQTTTRKIMCEDHLIEVEDEAEKGGG